MLSDADGLGNRAKGRDIGWKTERERRENPRKSERVVSRKRASASVLPSGPLSFSFLPFLFSPVSFIFSLFPLPFSRYLCQFVCAPWQHKATAARTRPRSFASMPTVPTRSVFFLSFPILFPLFFPIFINVSSFFVSIFLYACLSSAPLLLRSLLFSLVQSLFLSHSPLPLNIFFFSFVPLSFSVVSPFLYHVLLPFCTSCLGHTLAHGACRPCVLSVSLPHNAFLPLFSLLSSLLCFSLLFFLCASFCTSFPSPPRVPLLRCVFFFLTCAYRFTCYLHRVVSLVMPVDGKNPPCLPLALVALFSLFLSSAPFLSYRLLSSLSSLSFFLLSSLLFLPYLPFYLVLLLFSVILSFPMYLSLGAESRLSLPSFLRLCVSNALLPPSTLSASFSLRVSLCSALLILRCTLASSSTLAHVLNRASSSRFS